MDVSPLVAWFLGVAGFGVAVLAVAALIVYRTARRGDRH